MKNFIRSAVAIIAGFSIHASALASSIVEYTFTSSTNATFTATGVASTSVNGSRLSQFYIGNDGFGNVLEAYSADGTVTNADNALASNSYFSLSVAASSGKLLDIASLSFEVAKGGDNDPRGYFVRSSVDNFSTNIFASTLPSGSQAAPSPVTIDLSQFADQASIDFRIFVWQPSLFNSIDFRNLSLVGNVVNSRIGQVPEPVTFLLLLTGLGAIVVTRRSGTIRS